MLAIQCAVSDGSRDRSGDLISARPSVANEQSESKFRFIPGSMFCKHVPVKHVLKEFNRPNDKQVLANCSGWCGDVRLFRIGPNRQCCYAV